MATLTKSQATGEWILAVGDVDFAVIQMALASFAPGNTDPEGSMAIEIIDNLARIGAYALMSSLDEQYDQITSQEKEEQK